MASPSSWARRDLSVQTSLGILARGPQRLGPEKTYLSRRLVVTNTRVQSKCEVIRIAAAALATMIQVGSR
jgi:hypothetical protein